MRIPVLCYHALNASGFTYDSNDHVALEDDLRLIRGMGFTVADLGSIARSIVDDAYSLVDGNVVGLSFDDGTNFDFLDVKRPGRDLLKSFCRILSEAGSFGHSSSRRPCAVSFVIASPRARVVLDRTCIAGLDDWRDDWWRQAEASGLLRIGNHSWDHLHPTLDVVAQRDQIKGTFAAVDSWQDADLQIRQAEDYIESVLGGTSARLFAFPYGETNEYLVNEYLPDFQHQHRQYAAFSTAGDFVTSGANRWNLPRFVCGLHWRSTDELERILRSSKH